MKEVKNLPTTVSQLKRLINRQTGIPVRVQNLFDYPEFPDQIPGLRFFDDNHVFDENMQQVNLVLSLGKVCSWVYAYMHYPCGNGQTTVARINFHRFSTIAYVKRHISMAIGLQASDIQLSHKANGHQFNDNSNVYQCGIQNGSILNVS